MEAKLRFTFGTMGSGKSLEVLTTAHNFEQQGIPFIICKSTIDTRDGATTIKSRIGNGIEKECISIEPNQNIYDTIYEIIKQKNIKYILVDEVQFLSEEQIDQLSDIVDYLDIDVWCFGLRTDFKTKLFPGSKRLFEIANKIEESKSYCSCGKKNVINARFTKDGKLAIAGAQVEVGGDERYVAICRKCYKEKLKEQTL